MSGMEIYYAEYSHFLATDWLKTKGMGGSWANSIDLAHHEILYAEVEAVYSNEMSQDKLSKG